MIPKLSQGLISWATLFLAQHLAMLAWHTVAAHDLFTSMVDMESLAFAKDEFARAIHQYVDVEQQRLNSLKQFANQYIEKNRIPSSYSDHREIDADAEDGGILSANPLNAFLIVKRLTLDWLYAESLIKSNIAEGFLKNITEQRETKQLKFPTVDDLSGSTKALLRIQDTYDLPTSDLATGKIKGLRQAEALTAHDCFVIAQHAFNEKDLYHQLLWAEEAWNRVQSEIPPTAMKREILEHLCYALHNQNNTERAYLFALKFAEVDPAWAKGEEYLSFYKSALLSKGQKLPQSMAQVPPVANPKTKLRLANQELYDALCRGDIKTIHKNASSMHCYYKQNTPYLRLAPVKVEIVHFKPKVLIFRNVLSSSEMNQLTDLAKPKLARAVVVDKSNTKGVASDDRIAKSAWLFDNENPLMAVLNRRFEAMTDLTMASAEALQMANYGLGGHYDAHHDHAGKENQGRFEGLNSGNRIATLLFYLSTPVGGATVFPLLNLTVFATKGDAAFWHNLHRSGEGDQTTLHGACPVLGGIKWAANKWIHEYHNEFRRPCALDESEYE